MICLIFTKEDPEDFANYRPVSLTSVVYTVLELISKRAVLAFLSECKTCCQHGFLPHQACLSYLVILEVTLTRLGDGNTADVVYLDFAKARSQSDLLQVNLCCV